MMPRSPVGMISTMIRIRIESKRTNGQLMLVMTRRTDKKSVQEIHVKTSRLAHRNDLGCALAVSFAILFADVFMYAATPVNNSIMGLCCNEERVLMSEYGSCAIKIALQRHSLRDRADLTVVARLVSLDRKVKRTRLRTRPRRSGTPKKIESDPQVCASKFRDGQTTRNGLATSSAAKS